MDSLNFFISGISESWSTLSADQFFGMFYFIGSGGTTETSLSGSVEQMFNVFRFIAATAFVALLAWFVTKRLAGSAGMARGTGNLVVVESVNVGGQAVVRLVRAGDKYLVVGVTKERVTLLAEIDKEQIVEQQPPDFSNLNSPFGKVLSRFIQPKDAPGDEEDNE